MTARVRSTSRRCIARARDVHRFALFLSGDPALADDIVSETFVRAWHARSRLDLATVKAADVARAKGRALNLPATPAPPPSAEKKALDATRQLLKSRTSTLVIASLFTVLPFSFVFEGSRVTFIVLRDAPVIAVAWWATAATMWVVHFWIRRRVRVSGL